MIFIAQGVLRVEQFKKKIKKKPACNISITSLTVVLYHYVLHPTRHVHIHFKSNLQYYHSFLKVLYLWLKATGK